MIANYVAIDPLAILLPSSVYQRLVEKFNPHLPKVADIQEAARSMSAEERTHALASARSLVAYGKVVEEALSAKHSG